MFLRLLCLFISLPIGATVFQPQTIEQQIKEADGIIIGHYLKSKSIKLENGSIATQMIFKMNKEMGMQSDLFGMDEVIIHYPGGKVGDEIVKVEGVPSFVSGESVALMIKSREDRYWGLNLGMGSFKIVNYGNETLIVNSVFPEDRRVSQMKLEEFEKSVRTLKKRSLKVVLAPSYPSETDVTFMDRSPASENEGQIRSIASESDAEENVEKQPVINNLWLILLLAIMGGWFRLTRQKEVK